MSEQLFGWKGSKTTKPFVTPELVVDNNRCLVNLV